MLLRTFEKFHVRGVIRIAKQCVIALIAIIVLVLTAGIIALGSEPGRLWLVHTLIDQVNQSTNMEITLKGLKMPVWGQWQLQTIRIDQGGTAWLIAEQVELNWQPLALLNQTIVVNQLRATSFSVHKLPPSADHDTPPQVKEKIDGLGITGFAVPNIQLKNLTVDTFSLYGFQPSTDENNRLRYSVSARANWLKNSPVKIRVDMQGLDAIPLMLSVDIQSKDWVRATFEGSLQEPANGLLGKLLQLPAEQAIDAGFTLAVTKKTGSYDLSIQSLSFPLAQKAISVQGNAAVVTENSTQETNVYVNDLTLTIDDTQHSIIGSWVEKQFDVRLNLNQFPLDIIKPWKAAVNNGELTAQLTITGTIERPQAAGSFTLKTVYQDLPMTVDFLGVTSKTQVYIDNLQMALDQSEIRAKGTLDLVSDKSALDVSVKNVDVKMLDVFSITRPDNLNATLISANGRLFGPARSLNGDLTLSVEGDYEKEVFSADGEFTRKGNTVFINSLVLTAAGGSVSVEGDVRPDTLDANMSINAEAMPLTMLKLAGINLPENLNAQLQTQLTLKGNLRSPNIQGDAQLQGMYDAIPFLFEAKGRFQNNDAQVEQLTLFTFGEEVFTANGHYQVEIFDLSVQVKKLPTQLLSALGVRVQPGDFFTRLHVNGTLEKPELTGNLTYRSVLRGYDENSEQKDISFIWDLDISTSEEAFNFVSKFKRDEETPGQLLFSLPKQSYLDYVVNQRGKEGLSYGFDAFPVDASIAGKFNLQIMSFLLDPDLHRLTGELVTNIDVSGTLATPTINGFLQLQDGRYENSVTGTLIDGVNCQLNAKLATLKFDVCQATDGDKGSYDLSGDILLPFDDFAGMINLNMRTKSANVLRRPDIESEATGEIKLSGDFSSVLASGNLNLAPLTVLLDSPFSSGIPTLRIEEAESLQVSQVPDKEKRLTMPDVQFDLTLQADRQAYLRGRGLEAELQGEIALYGSLAKPFYDGDVKIIRGVFELFNKPFKLESGLLNFANNSIGLAITGVYEKKGQRIKAELSGTTDDLKIHLSAVPAMPEDEILAFVIFGKSIQKITPFEAVQLASAVQELRGGSSSFNLIGRTRKMLGVDALSVESADNGEGGSGVNVGVGQYLTDSVYFELERSPNPSQPWKGNVEIELAPNLSLESSTGGKSGIGGAQLKWKKDY